MEKMHSKRFKSARAVASARHVPWGGSDDAVRIQEEIQSDRLKDVLKERNDLQRQHILPNVVAYFKNGSLPNLIRIVIRFLREKIEV